MSSKREIGKRVIKNHRLTPFQWGFLLVIYIFSYIWYVGVDLSDGVIDMNGHGFFIALIILASGVTLCYGLGKQAHLYVR